MITTLLHLGSNILGWIILGVKHPGGSHSQGSWVMDSHHIFHSLPFILSEGYYLNMDLWVEIWLELRPLLQYSFDAVRWWIITCISGHKQKKLAWQWNNEDTHQWFRIVDLYQTSGIRWNQVKKSCVNGRDPSILETPIIHWSM